MYNTTGINLYTHSMNGTPSANGKETVLSEDTQKITEKGQEILAQNNYSEEITKKPHSYNWKPRIVKSQSNNSTHLQTTRSIRREDALKVTKRTKCSKRMHQLQQKALPNIGFVQPAAIAGLDFNDLERKETLTAEDRGRIINKIMEVLVECNLQNKGDRRKKAEVYEESVWQRVNFRKNYFELIATKLYDMRQKNQVNKPKPVVPYLKLELR